MRGWESGNESDQVKNGKTHLSAPRKTEAHMIANLSVNPFSSAKVYTQISAVTFTFS